MDMTERNYLEDLYVFDPLLSTAGLVDGAPLFDNALNVGLLEPCQSEIMAGVEAKNVTTALHRLGREQWVGSRRSRRSRRGKNSSVIVLEDHCVVILGIGLAAGACVAGTEVAPGVILGRVGLLRRLGLAEPWPLGAVRGDKDVLARERVDWDPVLISQESGRSMEVARTAAMGVG